MSQQLGFCGMVLAAIIFLILIIIGNHNKCKNLPALSTYSANTKKFHQCEIAEVISIQTFTHGHVYYARSENKGSWNTGKKFCESRGLKMARIYNTQENGAIYDMFVRVGSSINLGGKAPISSLYSITKEQFKDSFKWWSGDKVDKLGWNSREPDNTEFKSERYLHVNYKEGAAYSWGNIDGSHTKGYVACEERVNFSNNK